MDVAVNKKVERSPLKNDKDANNAASELRDPFKPEGPENPKLKKTKYTVVGAPHLYLVVTDKGAKYWNFRYRFEGKEKEAYVGKPFPQTSLSEAIQVGR